MPTAASQALSQPRALVGLQSAADGHEAGGDLGGEDTVYDGGADDADDDDPALVVEAVEQVAADADEPETCRRASDSTLVSARGRETTTDETPCGGRRAR